MKKLIIIDLDDTIVNYKYAHSVAFDLVIATIVNETLLSKEDILESYKAIKEKLYKLYDNKYNRHDKLLQIKLLCNELKIKNVATIYKLYEETYLDNIKLHDDCIEFLQLCKSKNIKVAIMSNNLLYIQVKVCAKLNLYQYINNLFTSHEFIYEKPDNEPLEYILDYYKVTKDEVIIIGDSLENDIEWGKKNNIKTILCDHKTNQSNFKTCIAFISTM
jgi:HAD superfamily hydrolase (TIGR01549 family)